MTLRGGQGGEQAHQHVRAQHDVAAVGVMDGARVRVPHKAFLKLSHLICSKAGWVMEEWRGSGRQSRGYPLTIYCFKLL
ncbi:hypothetical protein D3C72_2076430 [compost metagenome]